MVNDVGREDHLCVRETGKGKGRGKAKYGWDSNLEKCYMEARLGGETDLKKKENGLR